MRAIRFVLPGLFLALSTWAPAVTQAEPSRSGHKNTVVTASKRPQQVEKAPASMTVITGREIDERGYRTLRDLLLDVAGVEIQFQLNLL